MGRARAFDLEPIPPTTGLERELRQFARAAAEKGFPRPWQVERAAYVFCARYGLEPCVPTLEGIGKGVALTGGRISQILHRVECVATADKPDLPVTRQPAHAIYDYLPAPIAAADQRFRTELGPHASTRDVLRFAADFLGLNPAEVKARPVPLAEGTAHAARHGDRVDWSAAALRLAAGQSRCYGAAQLDLLAGSLALNTGVACDRQALARVVSTHPAVVWLDHKTGWFCFDSERRSPFESKLRKILAVATDRLPIDEFLSALATEWQCNDLGRGVAPLNLHYKIALARLRLIKWISVVQHNHIVPIEKPKASGCYRQRRD